MIKNMFEKFFKNFGIGFKVALLTLKTLYHNKSALIFPTICNLIVLMLMGTFAYIMNINYGINIFDKNIQTIMQAQSMSTQLFFYGSMILGTLIAILITTITNVGLTDYIISRFEQKSISVKQSLYTSLRHIPTIIKWSAISLVIRMLHGERKKSVIAKIIQSTALVAWDLATLFVIPIIAQENLGIIASIRKSTSLIKQTFGQTTGGLVGIRFIAMLGVFIIVPISIIVGLILSNLYGGFAIFMSVVIIACFNVFLIIQTTSNILIAAIYQHANNKPTGLFDTKTLNASFIPNKELS